MAKKGRVKLSSGVRKLKARGRGTALSAAERRAKEKRTGRKVNREERQGVKKSASGNKGASNQGDKPNPKYANAQNQSKGRPPMLKRFPHETELSEVTAEVRPPSSSDVLAEVRSELDDHGALDSMGIEVEVREHEVFLRGTVASRSDKTLAARIARDVWGVKRVRNELRIPSGNNPGLAKRAA